MNKYLALLLLPISTMVLAFNDSEDFSMLFVGVGYHWDNTWYSSDDDVELEAEASPVVSLGYKVDENSKFIISHQDLNSYTSLTYKRSIHEWAIDNHRFVPYLSLGVGMGKEETEISKLDILGFTGGLGLDYRLNSYVELTLGYTLSLQGVQVESNDELIASSGILSGGVSFGISIYPF
ncbi:outer membrane beta-barrel protein [Vibrio ziniensis]|uniref:Porin family protein n=1 Tax=Vibrio ziniensis TaxID=2711221 RepID=A0A6G7CEK0_9VIBR|nr:outer membrane beta-barrel protein [Vibrio ziniensis]QIH40512.1 porin family protein [Vibrio ziniensis]